MGRTYENRYASIHTIRLMNIDIGGVYRINFPNRNGGEIYGPHYAVVLSEVDSSDHTVLVAPITSKKPGRKYRGGVTLDTHKYQYHPRYDKCFVYIRKIQEIDTKRVTFEKVIQKDSYGNSLLDKSGRELFSKQYTKIYQLDDEDLTLLRDKTKQVIRFTW